MAYDDYYESTERERHQVYKPRNHGLDPNIPLNYILLGVAPSSYVCCRCEAKGVRLWRSKFTTPAANSLVYCIKCMARIFGVSWEVLYPQPEGWLWNGREWTYSLREYIPAIPTSRNNSFWGLGNVPAEALQWWLYLPILHQ